MSHLLQKSSSLKKKEDLTIDPPGQNGSPSEKLLGRTTTPMDFSTVYSWEGLDEICLENIVIASLNQDILKKNFEIIINALKKHTMQIGRLAKQNSDWEDSFNELRDKNDRSEREIKELQDANDILKTEEKNISQEIDKLKDKSNHQDQEIERLKSQIQAFQEKIKKLEENPNPPSSSSFKGNESLSEIEAKLRDHDYQLKGLNNLINELRIVTADFESKLNLLGNMKDDSNGDKNNLSTFIKEISDLKNKLNNYVLREDFDSVKADVDYLLMEARKLQEKFDHINNGFHLLKSEELPKQFNEINLEINNLKKEIDTIRKDIENSNNSNNEKMNLSSKMYDDLIKMINDLSEKLTDKVNCEDFDREITNLYEKINELLNKKGDTNISNNNVKDAKDVKVVFQPPVSTKDANMLKDLTNKVADLEGLIRKLQKDLSDQVTNFNSFTKETGNKFKVFDEKKMEKTDFNLDDWLRKFGGFESEIKVLKEKLGSNEKIISNHDIAINDILKELSKLRKRRSSNAQGNGMNPGQFSSLFEDMINKLRQELMKIIDDIKQKLAKKIEMEDLWKSEAAVLQKIDEIVAILMKKFCDKNETKKALIYIENKINQLFETVFGEQDKEKDALFAKKPLCWGCASCDKDLDKFQGRLGDYRNWSIFPPKNTSPERMGRFGVGYTRMLDDRRVHLAQEREKMKSQQINSASKTQPYDNFPDVNNNNKDPKVFIKPKTSAGMRNKE